MRLPDLAVELVQSQVDLIVTETVVASEAAKQATSTIPIVQAYGGELIVNGLAEVWHDRVAISPACRPPPRR